MASTQTVQSTSSDKSLPPPTASIESGQPLAEETAVVSKVGDGDQKVEDAPNPSEEPAEERESWDSKLEYFLTLVGYAVGFGNIWRFPYLLHSNGGFAFLIPYCIMLAFEGIPLFFLELVIGQRLRKGALSAWAEISPYLGGLGLAMGVTCYLVVLYYNTLVAYVLSYVIDSFRGTLAWQECSTASKEINGSRDLLECETAKQPSKFYWYRRALDISDSITDPGNFNWYLMFYLILSWIAVWAILIKGIKSSGKVVYFTALFPYLTLICFFIGNFFLHGWENGYTVLFKPDFSVLVDPQVWLTAGTQIFFSLGVAYGVIIVFASYLPANNDCYKDAVYVSLINCSTSLLAAVVIFPILGSQGTRRFEECQNLRKADVLGSLNVLAKDYHEYSISDAGLITEYTRLNGKAMKLSPAFHTSFNCDLEQEIRNSGSGTGLVFIAFAEAALHLPCPQFWCFLFFFMLFTLGIDSSFGTCEGAISAFVDLKLVKWPRWVITSAVCGSLLMFSVVFASGWGSYVQVLLDQFVANWTLLIIAFVETVGISYVYGLAKFSYDIKLMTGTKPNVFMLLCWKYISPALIIIILVMSVYGQFTNGYYYDKYDAISAGIVNVNYPTGIIIAGYLLWFSAVLWIPLEALLTYFGHSLLKKEKAAFFPEVELRAERRMSEQNDIDQFDTVDKLLMGRSIEDFMTYRAKSATSIHLELENSQNESISNLNADEKKSVVSLGLEPGKAPNQDQNS